MHIARKGEEVFLLEHFERFLAHSLSRFLELQPCAHGDDKDVVRAAAPGGDEGLEYLGGVLPKLLGDFESGDSPGRFVGKMLVRTFFCSRSRITLVFSAVFMAECWQ